jgi:hypothetical protein
MSNNEFETGIGMRKQTGPKYSLPFIFIHRCVNYLSSFFRILTVSRCKMLTLSVLICHRCQTVNLYLGNKLDPNVICCLFLFIALWMICLFIIIVIILTGLRCKMLRAASSSDSSTVWVKCISCMLTVVSHDGFSFFRKCLASRIFVWLVNWANIRWPLLIEYWCKNVVVDEQIGKTC